MNGVGKSDGMLTITATMMIVTTEIMITAVLTNVLKQRHNKDDSDDNKGNNARYKYFSEF